MGYRKYVSSVGTLAIAVCLEFVAFSVLTPPLRAQSQEVSVTFPRTVSRGAPSRTVGAGGRSTTRGSSNAQACLTGDTPVLANLTALTPSNNVATTVSANPTLFWYVPKTTAKSAELTVSFVDNQNKEEVVYQTTLPLQGTPGVVKVSFPKTVSLETGKNYLWNFTLICNPAIWQENVLLQGWLERTELSREYKTKLARAKDPLKQAEVYAEAKIWQETVSILAQLHQEHPNDRKVTDAWKELLDSVDLPAIATEPLVECCQADN